MSGYEYSSDVKGAPTSVTKVTETKTVTNTKNPAPRAGACATVGMILAILQFCMFVVLIGVSAGSIKQLKDWREDPARNTNACFLVADIGAWRMLIGILAVACAALVHSIIAFVLGISRKAGAFKYAWEVCIVPHAIIFIVLGCIILANLGTNSTWRDTCEKQEPYQLAYATGAIAVAFGGFILIVIPFVAAVACYTDIVAPALASRTTAATSVAVVEARRGNTVGPIRRDEEEVDYSDEYSG